jgi:hypothetical protein
MTEGIHDLNEHRKTRQPRKPRTTEYESMSNAELADTLDALLDNDSK